MINEHRHIQTPLIYFLPWAELFFEIFLATGLILKLFRQFNVGESLLLLSLAGLAIVSFLYVFTPGKGLERKHGQQREFGDTLTLLARRTIYLGIAIGIAGVSLHFLRKNESTIFLITGFTILVASLSGGAALNRDHSERLLYLRGSMIRAIILLVCSAMYALL